MCDDLDSEIATANVAAMALCEHLARMNANNAKIPIWIGDQGYLVSVEKIIGTQPKPAFTVVTHS